MGTGIITLAFRSEAPALALADCIPPRPGPRPLANNSSASARAIYILIQKISSEKPEGGQAAIKFAAKVGLDGGRWVCS